MKTTVYEFEDIEHGPRFRAMAAGIYAGHMAVAKMLDKSGILIPPFPDIPSRDVVIKKFNALDKCPQLKYLMDAAKVLVSMGDVKLSDACLAKLAENRSYGNC